MTTIMQPMMEARIKPAEYDCLFYVWIRGGPRPKLINVNQARSCSRVRRRRGREFNPLSQHQQPPLKMLVFSTSYTTFKTVTAVWGCWGKSGDTPPKNDFDSCKAASYALLSAPKNINFALSKGGASRRFYARLKESEQEETGKTKREVPAPPPRGASHLDGFCCR